MRYQLFLRWYCLTIFLVSVITRLPFATVSILKVLRIQQYRGIP